VTDSNSLKLDELAALAGTSPRTVRYYVQRGLLPAPAFRGKDTAYTREHLSRLRAIRKLQEGFLPLDAIQAELARLTVAEIDRLAEGEGPAPLAAPLGVVEPPPAVHSRMAEVGSRWTRWELLPGLELGVAEGASNEVRRIADEIRERIHRQKGANR
jgi:Ca-activated chloride channel family protein